MFTTSIHKRSTFHHLCVYIIIYFLKFSKRLSENAEKIVQFFTENFSAIFRFFPFLSLFTEQRDVFTINFNLLHLFPYISDKKRASPFRERLN